MFTLLRRYLTWNYGFLEKQGIKAGRPWPLFGTMLFRLQKPLYEADLEDYRKLGKVFGIYESRNPAIVTGDLNMIKMLLVKKFNNFTDRRFLRMDEKTKIFEKFLSVMKGEEWRLARPLLSPAFTTGKLKQMRHLMEQCAEDMCQRLMKANEKSGGEGVEVKEIFGTYSLDIIATCAFGSKVNVGNEDEPFLRHVRAIFAVDLKWKLPIFLFAPKLAMLLGLEIFPSESIQYFKDIALSMMNARRKDGMRRPDFLQLLLDVQKDEEMSKMSPSDESSTTNADVENEKDHYDVDSEFKISSNPYAKNKKVLTEETVIAQAMLFFIAGFDTVSTALSLTLYCLALNPDCQEKLIDEIEAAQASDDIMGPDTIRQMEYLDKVLSEAFRMYPPATRVERQCTTDCKLENIVVKKGMVVSIPVYAVHHDEDYYPDPEKFDPERFSHENKAKRNPYCYLPFGAGPRNCIGMRFALMEIKIALVRIFLKFRVSTCSATEIPLTFRKNVGLLMPEHGVTLKLTSRT